MIKKLLTFVALSAATIFSANAQTAASAVDGKKQTIYSSVNHASTPYRIPAVATLNNGTVLAIADQRPCGADVGNGEVDIYAKVGTIAANGSYSWNPSTNDPSADDSINPIADGTDTNGYGDAAVVVDRESGKVLVICVAGKQVFIDGSSSAHNNMARIVRSSDGAWQGPENVTPAFFDDLLPNAYTMFMASGKMVQSKHVKVGDYYRIYGALLVRESGPNHNNYVVYSDDFGESWSILGNAKACGGKYSSISFFAGNYADEAKVEELPNGDIVISSRTSGGRYFNVFNFTDLNSATGSWGSATSCTFAGSNSTNGEIMLYKGLVDANGTEYNVMLQSLPTGSSRSNVAVYYKAFTTSKTSWAVSDFTSGWTKGIEVDDGASAYSTMTILPNGQVGFLYEDDYDTSKADGDYSNIVYVPLTVEEITGGAFSHVDATAPTFSHNGEVEEGTQVTISAATGTTIYYTTDGTAPSRASTKYTDAITVNSAMTIKAIAVKDCDYTYSAVATATFTVKATAPVEKVASPTFSIAGGEVEEGTTVTISCATDGATIYYTTDGNEPTTSSAVYNGAIIVNSAMTIKAFATKDGYTDSEVASATFTIKAREVVATPVISPAGGEVEEGTTVTISCATSGATIYYTTDGNEPTTASAVYSGAIVVDKDMTIKAFAAKDGYYTNSAVATATFTIKEVVVEPEVTEYPVTPVSGLIGGTTYYLATFSASENTVAPAGVSVFYVKTVSSDEVALSRVSSGKTIPAGEGVILMASSASAFNMTSTTDESNVADLSDNCLAATLDVVDFTFNVENCYALAVKGSGELAGQFAFCKVAAGTTLNGYNNRAYLDLSASGASFSNNVRVSFDGVTGIESSVEEFQEQVIYDICGRRAHEMKPGNIYIVNGKKVLKK